MAKYIVGINAFHGDSSACILKNGQLIAAVEEERFRRIKHWAGFPSESIRYCLNEADIELNDVEYLAINSNKKANLSRKLKSVAGRKASIKLVTDRIRFIKNRDGIHEYIDKAFPGNVFKGKIQNIEHHIAHLASGYLVSPFKHAVTVSIDGLGDFASAAWGIGKGEDIDVIDRVFFPHSLGIFYEALTHYLGFKNYGDEYKVMGLAPYGEARYLDRMREIVILKDDGRFNLNLDYFSHHLGKGQHQWDGGDPASGDCFSKKMEELLGEARKKDEPIEQNHKDIACSVQIMYEEALYHLLNVLYKKYKIENLSLSGGCAMNSVANGKITQRTPFKKVYIQPAAGDAGGAIGAAFVVWNRINKNTKKFVMDHAYWGPEYTDIDLAHVIEEYREKLKVQGCSLELIKDEVVLCNRVADAIVDGKVIGWFQGRMEWGPRALGNRSILGDPRRSDMKDILNNKIKRRESFRPFAPSILREYVGEWFEQDDDVPFMMKVFMIKEEKRSIIPAVTHVDGTGRLQTVTHKSNPRYYKLISSFHEKTGVPILLNTSFNENEPIVCKPEEALDCFLRTNMDVLVLGNYYIERNSI